jgi:hypothetical protein
MAQSADQSAELMSRLLIDSGAGNVSADERTRLEQLLQRIKRGYETRPRITLSKTNIDSRQRRQLLH